MLLTINTNELSKIITEEIIENRKFENEKCHKCEKIHCTECIEKYLNEVINNSKKSNFTNKQIEDWKKYVKVRDRGNYNMFSPFARKETGLSNEEYLFCMNNASELIKETKIGEK